MQQTYILFLSFLIFRYDIFSIISACTQIINIIPIVFFQNYSNVSVCTARDGRVFENPNPNNGNTSEERGAFVHGIFPRGWECKALFVPRSSVTKSTRNRDAT